LKKLDVCFRNAHAIAKHDKSFRDYEWLCKLDKAKGLDIGSTYDNFKAGKTFMQHIACVESDRTKSLLNNAQFFSLTIDGASDISGTEQESIYVHWCDKGVRRQRFVEFVSPQSTSSQDIYDAVAGVLVSHDIDQNKMVGVTTDGASNMMGCKRGFSTLLKNNIPDLVAIHCIVHRLELSVKDSVKVVQKQMYDKSMTLLIGLYYLYKRSSKQKKHLETTFEILNMRHVFPTRVGGTRWVPHTIKAIDSFFRSYQAIVTHLDNASHSVPKAEGLSKLAHDVNIILYLVVLKVSGFI
jgi:hypothetical protein